MTEQLSIELIPTGLRSRSLWAAYSYFLPPGGGVRLFFSCLDYVWLFETPWTAPSQASLSFTITRSGFQYLQNSSKILLRISLNGEPGLCPKATLLFLFTGSPPSLQLFKSADWNPVGVLEAKRSVFPVIKKCRIQGFVPQNPTGSCLVSPQILSSESFFNYSP